MDSEARGGALLLSAARNVLRGRAALVVSLAALGIGAYGLRVWMLGRYAAPPSGDYGIYLADVRALLGQDVTGFGSAYPPVFLLPLGILIQFIDPVTALRFFTPTAMLALPFPFYRIVSRYSARPWAFLATFLFVLNEGYSEMTGWGGGPDLLAITFMLCSLAFLLPYMESRRLRDLALAGAFAGLVVGTHHLTALVYAATLATWCILEVIRARSLRAVAPFARMAAWSALFSLPFIPYYLSFGQDLAPQVLPIWPQGFENIPGSLYFLFRESVILWVAIVVLGVVGATKILRSKREGVLLLSFVMVDVVLGIGLLQDNPTRPLYYLYIPVLAAFPTFFVWAERSTRHELPARSKSVLWTLLVGFAICSSAVMAGQSTVRMSTAVDWYHAINQPELEAMDWIRTNTPRDAVVATAGVPFALMPEGTRYAWWIEGYGERRSFYGGSPIYAALQAERTMVEAANLFFAGNVGEQHSGLRLNENAPSSLANPAVSVNSELGYETAFFLNDAVTVVEYAPLAAPNSTSTWTPYYWVPTVYPVWTGSGQDVLMVPRGDANIQFIRNETLQGPSVVVEVTATARNGTVRALEVPIWVGWTMRLRGTIVTGSRVTGQLVDSSGTEVPFQVDALVDASTSLNLTATNVDPTFGQPWVNVVARANSSSSAISVRLVFSFPSVATGPIQRWDASAIGNRYAVSYVFQNQFVAELFYRFDQDTQHFRRVYSNSEVAVYSVVAT